MGQILRLCQAARTIHAQAEVVIVPATQAEHWSIRIAVGSAILLETVPAPWDEAMHEATRKLRSLSQRTLKAMQSVSPGPPDEE